MAKHTSRKAEVAPGPAATPIWYQRLWAWLHPPLTAVLQLSIILAALSFLQRQEPAIEATINHQTKLLTVSKLNFSPTEIKIYAVAFDVDFALDEQTHLALRANNAIRSFYTQGFVSEYISWTPWRSSTAIDVTRDQRFDFLEWKPDVFGEPQHRFYCFLVAAKNLLSLQRATDIVLTDRVKFSASLFGPMARSSAIGGGYPTNIFKVEAEMKAACLTVFDKVR